MFSLKSISPTQRLCAEIPDIGTSVAIGTVALVVLALGGFNIGAVSAAAVVLSLWLMLACGRCMLRERVATHFVDPRSAFLVAGYAIMSIATLALVLCFGITAGIAYCGVAALALCFIVADKFARRHEHDSAESFSAGQLLGVTLSMALAAFFCRHQITAFSALVATNILHPWNDHLVHGSSIAQFGSPIAVGRGNILEVGRELPLYHYGMFMMPAALLSLPGAPPALALSVSALLMFGLFMALLGCVFLGDTIGGPGAGLVAASCLMLMPDGSLWPGNGFFGFHWLLLTAPGSGYAIGIAAVALAYLVRWLRTMQRRDLVICGVMTCAVALFRAQIFVVVTVAVVFGFTFRSTTAKARAWLAGGLAAVAVLAFGVDLEFANAASRVHFWTDLHGFILRAYETDPTNTLTSLYAWAASTLGRVSATALGLATLPVLMLGPMLMVLIAALSRVRRQGNGSDFANWLPLLLFLAYLSVIVFSGMPSNGDITEYKQRPFVLFYAGVATWSLATLFGGMKISALWRTRAALALSVLASATAFFTLQDFDPQDISAVWARAHVDTSFRPGLISEARIALQRRSEGDTMVTVGLGANDAMLVSSIAGIPQYFVPGGVEFSRSSSGSLGVPSERPRFINGLGAAAASNTLTAQLRNHSVDWLLTKRGDPSCSSEMSVSLSGDACLARLPASR